VLALLLVLSLAGTAVLAAEPAQRPEVDATTLAQLPPLAPGWAALNPLRGQPQAVLLGRQVFNQACASCHGADADGSRSPAPDLRRIGLACQRVKEPALRQRCLSDADHFFVQSVRFGKQKFGIQHMPPWEGVLEPGLVWALRSYVETAGRP
jgi:mono/diheme cytochrome c family protein